MAGATMYAWSTFVVERNEHGQPTKTIDPGESVTQAELKVEDEEWEYLVETGAVREDEYPDVPAGVSPAEYQKSVDNAKVELVEAQAAIDTLQEMGVEEDAEPKDRQPNVDTPVAKQPAAAREAAKDK